MGRVKKRAENVVRPEPVKQNVNARTVIVLITVLFVGLCCAYNYFTPITTPVQLHGRDGGAANPDEPAHLLYVESLAAGHIPVFSPKSADYEAAQPPLYYGVTAVIYKLSPASTTTKAHNCRWIATILGIVFIWLVFLTVQEQFSNKPELALLTSIVIGLTPMNISLCSSVSNDTATNVIFALFLFQFGRLVRKEKQSNVDSVLIGLIVAAGIWTKSSSLLLVPVVVIAYGASAYFKAMSTGEALRGALISLFAALVISSPWLVRNQMLYGDPFAANVVFQQLAARNFSTASLISVQGWPWYLTTFILWTFESFWGVFDSMNLFLQPQVYGLLALFSIPSLIVGKWSVLTSKKTNVDRAVYFVWASLVLLTFASYVDYNVHFFQTQGRYLYTGVVPIAAIGSYGLLKLAGERYGSVAKYGAIAGLSLLNILCLLMISGRYS